MTSAQIALAEGWGVRATLSPLGSGRINDSYLAQGAEDRWMLQRINPFVFRKPEVLMANVARASAHLNAKRPGWTPTLIPTRDGASHAQLDSGVWRLWSYAKGRSLAKLDNDRQAEAAGRALGQTHRWLADLPGPRLEAAIPGHLQLDRCLVDFDACVGVEPQLIDFINARRHLAARFRGRTGTIHGDGHLDNFLFGEDGTVSAVLDLDTVMWGHWAWDFGDLVRSALGGQALPTRFAAVAHGYLDAAQVRAEVDDLVMAPRYVTFMIGLRYLTDHLDGDRYFKVGAHGENRHRALDRFRFLQALEAAEPAFMDSAASLVETRGLEDGLNDDDDRDH
ncbi:MAG: aminoglycoside phosphotransferase family protein [Gammaproteobacteria bacterium]|nr:aminoglycoside phosphotransferase family protein [Gammaproteobacteria bacterium]MDE0270741.1 aminoglycoside phosphotransferase family protein [Gammaproteobacteria bacterium]